MECHYSILGISKDATIDDIKKAYKKLALLYHPDKNNGDDCMFKKINYSYQILINPTTRYEYDFNTIPNTTTTTDFLFKLFNMVIKIAKDIKNATTTNTSTSESPPDTTNKELPVTKITINVKLEDLYYARIKKIILKIKKDNIYISKPFYISLLNYKTSYVFLNQGDDGADLCLNLNIRDHPIKIDQVLSAYDLYYEHSISLYDFYYGIDFTLTHLDGEILKCNKSFKDGNNMTYVFKDKGLPQYNEVTQSIKRGDLYIFFNLNKKPHSELDLDNIEFKQLLKTYFS
jgi:DnaJ-class molecular chaperone